MLIKEAEFVVSNTDPEKCPKAVLPEYAFIGRSNVGKSSLINALLNNKSLAKTSSKPGKTQLINHFIVNKSWYLVDLPGYGYAGVSKNMRSEWKKFIIHYINTRANLMNLFVLVDSRIEPQKIDIDFINYLGEKEIPFYIVFTKTDKISPNVVQSNAAAFKRKLEENWETCPPFYFTSAEKKQGLDVIVKLIETNNEIFSLD
jgi:GTP-binding protein